MVESEEEEEDNINSKRFKIIFIGEPGVGKDLIIDRLAPNPFNEESIGVDFRSIILKYKKQNLKFQIWDSAGQEKYKGLIPSYIRNSSIIFIVYDISSKNTFNNIPKWINFVKSIEKTKIVLCGNITDLERREVEKIEAENFAKKEGISFFEICAESNENLKLMFYTCIADLPIFDDIPNKDSLIKELLEENENIQNSKNDSKNKISINNKIYINDKEKKDNKKKEKKDRCLK